MDTLFSRYRNAVVLVAALFLQLVLLAFQIKRDKDVPLIRIWAVGAITPVEKLVSSGVRGVYGVWHNYADLRQARQESQGLLEEVSRLKLERHRLLEEVAEARRLRALVQFRDLTPSVTVAARVIGSSASETSRALFLDKGSESGIRPNMAVITPDGIVGKVHRVFRGSAQVLVITDPDSGVGAELGALLQSSRVHGALRGYGGFFCQLRYIANDEKVEPGDLVVTSGEDRIYPRGLPIGLVTSAKNGPVFKEIMVQPLARLNRLEEVLVVTRGADQEIPARPEPAPAVAETTPAEPPRAPPASAVPGSGVKPAADAAAKPKAVPGLAGSRTKPETDADRLQDAYRAAQAQKSEAQRALGGLMLPATGGGVTDMARQPPPTVAAPAARKPPAASAAPGSAGVPPAQGPPATPRKAPPQPTPPAGSNVAAPLATPRKAPPTTGGTASSAPTGQPPSPARKAPSPGQPADAAKPQQRPPQGKPAPKQPPPATPPPQRQEDR
jgi:rod shape-determining protein MreC